MHAMRSLRPTLRIHAVAVAIMLCLTLVFVALTRTEELIARLFFGFFSLVVPAMLIAIYRKETMLANDHLIASATITEVTRGRRGRRNIKYRFVALNGVEYRGESDWARKIASGGTSVTIMYKPLAPAVNQPLTRFLFYSFDAYGS
jgi:hypothetical protein